MTEDKKEKSKGSFEAVNVPTEHRLAIQNPDGELMNEIQLLAEMANDLKEIKQSIVG